MPVLMGNHLQRLEAVMKGGIAAIGLAVTAVKALQMTGSLLVDAQRGTARYSGSMSMAAANLDVSRIGRDMQTAGSTGASFAKLTVSLDKLERAMQPFKEAMTKFVNNGLSELLNLGTSMVNLAKPAIPLIDATGKAIEALSVGIQAWWENKSMQQVRNERAQADQAAQNAINARGLQNFSDLMALRVNIAAANGVNQPNPNIPAGPIKGPNMPGGPAGGRNMPPVVNPFLWMIPNGGIKN
jgi:hypothetical protein